MTKIKRGLIYINIIYMSVFLYHFVFLFKKLYFTLAIQNIDCSNSNDTVHNIYFNGFKYFLVFWDIEYVIRKEN